MILYALHCAADHPFEAWFSSSSDYDDQAARGLVECPFCETPEVAKPVKAPAVSGTKKRDTLPAAVQTLMSDMARQVRAHVEANFDYVGDTFAREARAIHEGASEQREIYGEATAEEVEALKEDGIPCAPLPVPPPDPSKAH